MNDLDSIFKLMCRKGYKYSEVIIDDNNLYTIIFNQLSSRKGSTVELYELVGGRIKIIESFNHIIRGHIKSTNIPLDEYLKDHIIEWEL